MYIFYYMAHESFETAFAELINLCSERVFRISTAIFTINFGEFFKNIFTGWIFLDVDSKKTIKKITQFFNFIKYFFERSAILSENQPIKHAFAHKK